MVGAGRAGTEDCSQVYVCVGGIEGAWVRREGWENTGGGVADEHPQL